MDPALPRPWHDGARCAALPPPDPEAPGVFETLRAEDGRVRALAAHLARLERGARLLGLPWPPPWDPRAALALLAREAPRVALRLSWAPPHLALSARALPEPPDAPALRVLAPGAVLPPVPHGAKTLARQVYDRVRAAARAEGAFEALVRGPDGSWIEGTATNVFAWTEDTLCTPPLASGALPGTLRARVLALDGRPGGPGGKPWRCVERPLGAATARSAAEILLTNALVLAVGVARVLEEGAAVRGLPGAAGPCARALNAALTGEEGPERVSGAPGR